MPQAIKTIHFGGVNCYLVKTSDDGYVLIDTGFSTKRTDIEQAVTRGTDCDDIVLPELTNVKQV